MINFRFHLAVIAAKLSVKVIHLLGRNASHNPGVVALKICPDFLERAPKAPLAVCVTGTNGKTTVSNMLTDALLAAGMKTVSNRTGSNIVPGCATNVVNSLSLWGKCRVDATVFEVDERASRLILPYLKPDYLIVTNLFRDSLKRNAHPDYIFSVIDTYCPDATRLILNADDLCSSMLKPGSRRTFFGIGKQPGDLTESLNLVADYSICPKCGAKLQYRYLRYHHIGNAFCPSCSFESYQADYLVTDVDKEKESLTIRYGNRESVYPLISDVTFNIYNELTIIAAMREIGIADEKVQAILKAVHVPDSRLNETQAGGVTVVQMTSKGQSCISVSRTFDLVANTPGKKAIILAMDDPYDRRRSIEYIGWIYDVEYEQFNRDDVVQIVVAGPRCYDHKARLLLAGVPENRIVCSPDELTAVDRVLTTEVDKIYILYEVTLYETSCRMKERLLKRLEGAK